MTSRDRSTLIVGTVFVLSAFVCTKGIPVLNRWEGDQLARAVDAASLVSAAERGRKSLPIFRDSLLARTQRLVSTESTLIVAETPQAAAAVLSTLVDGHASEAQIRISSMQLRSDSIKVGRLGVVGVRLIGVGDVAGLSEFLRLVEGGNTPLAVREIGITQPAPAAGEEEVEMLRIEILISGLARVIASRDG